MTHHPGARTGGTHEQESGRADQPELRLALAMRGGVSLAVWMGGACAEIDSLRRASEPVRPGGDDPATAFWREVLERSPYSRVVVDVIAGASAGGLNGVVFGAAIRHGFSMADLFHVWRKVAAIDRLRRQAAPWLSVLDGDTGFLDEVHESLRALVGSGVQAGGHDQSAGTAPAVDLQLTATLIEPVSMPATSPVDEALRRNRSAARFHFRHDGHAVFPRTDLEEDGLDRLAVAARSSASFPFAFEAAAVRSTRTGGFRLSGAPSASRPTGAHAHRWVDCRGMFSESRGGVTERGPGLHPDDFVVADGGILDNIPITRALDAVRRMPASGPTRRVLVYMHPTGPAAPAVVHEAGAGTGRDRRGPRSVLTGLITSRLQGESIDEDLERIEEANRNLRLRRQARRAAAARSGAGDDLIELARTQVDAYLEQRAVVDADEVRGLLRDPLIVLGEDPFPVDTTGLGDDRWRAPLALWPAELRIELDDVLRTTFRGRLDERRDLASLLTGGLGPLLRTVDLLTEVAHAIEAMTGNVEVRGQVGRHKAELYRLGSLLGELERIRRIGWVTVAGRPVGERGAGVEARAVLEEWITAALDDLNLLLLSERRDAVVLCDAGAEVAAPDLDRARTALLTRSEELLDRLAGSTVAVAVDVLEDPVDIRDAVADALGRVAIGLVERWPTRNAEAQRTGSDPTRSDVVIGADFIRRVLVGAGNESSHPPEPPDRHGAFDRSGVADSFDGSERPGGPGPSSSEGTVARGDLTERFAALEVLLVREHLLGPSAGVEVGFVRMSAAAPTVDAPRFARLHDVSSRLDPEGTDDHHLLPDVKLAGNELSNFAAFLDERWRVNDWHWGRMDAVPTLVDLVLGADRAQGPTTPGTTEAERRDLTRRRQDQVMAEVARAQGRPVEDVMRTWDIGLETLTVPGSRDVRRSMTRLGRVGARVAGAALNRPRLAWVLQFPSGWLAGRLARPSGGEPGD